MLTVYICDDNRVILDKYKRMVSEIARRYDIILNIQAFTSGEQLLFQLESDVNGVDIIYLDILLEGENGVEIARTLRGLGCYAEIIFLTANPEYVFESFDVSPVNYILKDTVTTERFETVFFKAAALSERKSDAVFLCENGFVTKKIPIVQILFFEVSNRIVTVHYDNDTFEFYAKLEEVENKLVMKNFIRVHRSYLVHLRYIDQISRNSVLLVGGQSIPLGGTYVKNVKYVLSRYLNLFH